MPFTFRQDISEMNSVDTFVSAYCVPCAVTKANLYDLLHGFSSHVVSNEHCRVSLLLARAGVADT